MSEEYEIACEGSMNLRIGEIASAFKPMHDRNEVSEEGLVGIIGVVIGSCRLCDKLCSLSYLTLVTVLHGLLLHLLIPSANLH